MDHQSSTLKIPHRSAYPLEEVLRLFAGEGFSILAVTEHISQVSAETYQRAVQLRPHLCPDIFLVEGREVDYGFHITELIDQGNVFFRIMNHPARKRAPEELLSLVASHYARQPFDAVELDCSVGLDSRFVSQYGRIETELGLPVIANSDFHGDVLAW